MKNLKPFFLLLCTLLWTPLTWAHGEDKLGPNNGYLRMPGGFHTEVVPAGPRRVKVYLLDINWKNPSVENSSLSVVHENKKKRTPAKCTLEDKVYACEFPESVSLEKGTLTVQAKRENQTGNAVSYALPFKLKGGGAATK